MITLRTLPRLGRGYGVGCSVRGFSSLLGLSYTFGNGASILSLSSPSESLQRYSFVWHVTFSYGDISPKEVGAVAFCNGTVAALLQYQRGGHHPVLC
jgi:hypothetical protein